MVWKPIQQDLGLAAATEGMSLMTLAFLVWESKYILMHQVKSRKRGKEKVRGHVKMMSSFPLTTQAPNTGAQKLQAGLNMHSPEPHCPPRKNSMSSLCYVLYWLIKMTEKSLEKLL